MTILDDIVARQRNRAPADAQVAGGTALGGAVLEAFLDDQAGRGGGDLGRSRCGHGGDSRDDEKRLRTQGR